ncbi:MAG: hypothetical protein HY288_18270 [Planctomycetia bacterium]|nr:hypothetical protein [Planctomycetia bacterium]
MVGRILLLTAVVVGSSYLVAPVVAQDANSPSGGRSSSLSERLEQFRQDLLGESQPGPRGGSSSDESFSADRKVMGPPRLAPQSRAPKPAPPQRAATAATEAPALAAPAVTTPPRLQSQSARRAQAGPHSATVEPADRGTQYDAQKSPAARRSMAKQTPTPAKREDADDIDEPRIAKSLPKTVAPKELSETTDEPARSKSSKAGTLSGVLFTTQSPALSVEATGPRKVIIGKEAQFTVKIRNAGAAANNVVVAVNIPNYAEVVSAQTTAGTAQAPAAGERREPLEWKISRLEARGSETLNLKLVPRKSTPLDLAVQWTFTPEASQTLVEVQEPKLAMTVSGPDEVLYGQSKIYKLTVSNPGNGDTENVIVGLSPVGHSSDGSANHRLGTLRAGESKTIDVELTARQAGVLTIKAQAFADDGLRAEAAQQVLVRRASLRVEVEAPRIKYAGTVGTYHAKVINAGNATAENVQLAAMLPPEAKYVSSNAGGRLESQQGKVNWMIGTMQPGAERAIEMQCSLSAPGENRMQFVTAADGDLSAAATSSTRVEALADLKLEIRDPQGPIAVGEDTLYEVHIRNRGTKAADTIDLTVFFSEGLEAVAVDGGPHEIGPGQVVFKPISTLAAGESAVFRVRARAEKSGNHIFRAEVVCRSLQTKLSAEEATRFYGDEKAASIDARREGEPHLAQPRELAPAEEAPK